MCVCVIQLQLSMRLPSFKVAFYLSIPSFKDIKWCKINVVYIPLQIGVKEGDSPVKMEAVGAQMNALLPRYV